MENIKMVHGSIKNRTYMTPSKQNELKEKLFELDIEENGLTASDIFMSIGVYIGFPLMIVAAILFALSV